MGRDQEGNTGVRPEDFLQSAKNPMKDHSTILILQTLQILQKSGTGDIRSFLPLITPQRHATIHTIH